MKHVWIVRFDESHHGYITESKNIESLIESIREEGGKPEQIYSINYQGKATDLSE